MLIINRAKTASQIGRVIGRFEKNPIGIVRIDGGFSSQLLRYALGWQLKEQGYRVKYDLTFFENDGKSIDGKDERIFRLRECFPYLEIPEADKKQIERYRKYYDCELNGNADRYMRGERIIGPFYVPDITKLTQTVSDLNRIYDLSRIEFLMSESDKKIYDKFVELKKDKRLVGVHVRRGDMALTGHYWKVLTAEYYIEVINSKKDDDTVFCFFSEDFEWVRANILPMIDVQYILVDQISAEYVDFYLYSLCNILIASQSSWGRRAMSFNSNNDKKLILPEKKGESITQLERIYGQGRVEIVKLRSDMYISD